jgi:hypothetical protein
MHQGSIGVSRSAPPLTVWHTYLPKVPSFALVWEPSGYKTGYFGSGEAPLPRVVETWRDPSQSSHAGTEPRSVTSG